MPSGARTSEQGRPCTCGIIHSPTASKYCASSSLLTARSSPASGHRLLPGVEMVMPMTETGPPAAALPPAATAPRLALARRGADADLTCASASFAGFSACTSPAGLLWHSAVDGGSTTLDDLA